MNSGVGLLAPKINLSFLEAEMHLQSTAVCCLHSSQSSCLWIHCRYYSQLPSFPHLPSLSPPQREFQSPGDHCCPCPGVCRIGLWELMASREPKSSWEVSEPTLGHAPGKVGQGRTGLLDADHSSREQRHKPEELEGLDREFVDPACGSTQTNLILCL